MKHLVVISLYFTLASCLSNSCFLFTSSHECPRAPDHFRDDVFSANVMSPGHAPLPGKNY